MNSVLIVEDEIELNKMISNHIKELGLSVDTAYTAEEGLQKIATKNFALVVSDIRMPGLDGLQMMRKVLCGPGTHPTFFIMSGYSDYPLEQVIDLGAAQFFEKPSGLINLFEQVQAFFTRRHANM